LKSLTASASTSSTETLIEALLSVLARIDELERVVASQAATIQQLQD
jgi:hypothetical protein